MNKGSWADLLVEPKALLGPYQAIPPSLDSFAPHSIRMDFDNVAVAGQFMELPRNPSEKWAYGERFRAYAVFQFAEVRKVQSAGFLKPAAEDDVLHGVPVGELSQCVLEETPDVFMMIPGLDRATHWRRFSIRTSTFSLELEAGTVQLFCGRQAHSQYGWPHVV
ncbi:hypothetical protein GCM10027343_41720 [Noviherbaspirillum agri]